jgi:integrase
VPCKHGTTSGGRDPTTRACRPRGSIETLPSGSLRVRVYAGVDPITRRQHYLTQTIPRIPSAEREAETVRRRLITMVEERRQPRTNATLGHLLERHVATMRAGAHTRGSYRGYLRKHITPLIEHLRAGAVPPETLDGFYAELARCRDHCGTPAAIKNATTSTASTVAKPPRTSRKHHECRPLSAATIRKIHFLISGAYRQARRWGWLYTSPTEPPRVW